MESEKFKNLSFALNVYEENKIEYIKTQEGVKGKFCFFYDGKMNELEMTGANVHDFFSRLGLTLGDEEVDYKDLRKELYSLNTFDKMIIKGRGDCVAISTANRRKYVQKFEDTRSLDLYLESLQESVTKMQNDFAPIVEMKESELSDF